MFWAEVAGFVVGDVTMTQGEETGAKKVVFTFPQRLPLLACQKQQSCISLAPQ